MVHMFMTYWGCLIMLSLLPRPGYNARLCSRHDDIPANNSKTALLLFKDKPKITPGIYCSCMRVYIVSALSSIFHLHTHTVSNKAEIKWSHHEIIQVLESFAFSAHMFSSLSPRFVTMLYPPTFKHNKV